MTNAPSTPFSRSGALLRLIACFLLCAGLLLCAASDGAARPEADESSEQEDRWVPPVRDPGEIAEPEDSPVICYSETAAFLIKAPKGWDNDSETAAQLGVCAVYAPAGSGYHDGVAVLYPNVGTAKGKNIEETADIQAEWIRSVLAKRPQGESISVRAGAGIRTAKGQEAAIRFYDQGPPPNEWEAAAYMQHNGRLLMLVLSAREKADRDAYIPQLEEAARQVISMDFALSDGKKQGE